MRGKTIILALALSALCVGQAEALEYTMEAPEDYLFGRATSVEIIHGLEENPNVDRSKNVSLIPPRFGSQTSYLPGSGEYLTPNLVPGALSGGLVTQVGSVNYPITSSVTAGTGGDGGFALPTSVDGAEYPDNPTFSMSYQQNPTVQSRFTDVTADLYYSAGHLGTLKIPSIGVSVKIYQGTDTAQRAKDAGHFTDTSIWDGNVCLAGHNRGSHGIFGDLHTLDVGDKVTLTTKLGTRTYAVSSVKKISETDNTDTASTSENCITLYTCVRDQSEYRWCVRATEITG